MKKNKEDHKYTRENEIQRLKHYELSTMYQRSIRGGYDPWLDNKGG